MAYKIKLKKGDLVMVRAGKYKGKTGKVIATHTQDNKVTVEGINVVKKHLKATQTRPQGGIVEITKPIWVSKVGVIEPTTKRPSRIGMQLNKDGSKSRIYKISGKPLKELKPDKGGK